MIVAQSAQNKFGRSFKIRDWNVHVLKGQPELLDGVKYISFAGDFGFRYGYPLPCRDVVEKYIKHEKNLLIHFDVNIINLEFFFSGMGSRKIEGNKVKSHWEDHSKDIHNFYGAMALNKEDVSQWHSYLESIMLDVLLKSGYHAVSLANNHSLDYGPEGIFYNQDKLTQVGMSFFGTKQRPYLEINLEDIRGVVFAMTDLIDKEDSQGLIMKLNNESISFLKDTIKKYDLAIAFVHLISTSKYPSTYQQEHIDNLIDAGFQLVICTGSHWVKGGAFRKGVPVIFGTGNHLFSYADRFTEHVGMHVVAGISHGEVIQVFVIPFHNNIYKGIVGPLKSSIYQSFVEIFQERSDVKEGKFFRDENTLYEFERSIQDHGFFPIKLSFKDPKSLQWQHIRYVFKLLVNNYPRLVMYYLKYFVKLSALIVTFPILVAVFIFYIFNKVSFLVRKASD